MDGDVREVPWLRLRARAPSSAGHHTRRVFVTARGSALPSLHDITVQHASSCTSSPQPAVNPISCCRGTARRSARHARHSVGRAGHAGWRFDAAAGGWCARRASGAGRQSRRFCGQPDRRRLRADRRLRAGLGWGARLGGGVAETAPRRWDACSRWPSRSSICSSCRSARPSVPTPSGCCCVMTGAVCSSRHDKIGSCHPSPTATRF